MADERCKIGIVLNEECDKHVYCRKSGRISVDNLTEADRHLLIWRSGVTFIKGDQICLHHEKFYLTRYESLQRFCADPFSRHKKHITKSLRPVDEEMATKFNLKPGQRLCSNCYDRCCAEHSDTQNSANDDYHSPEYDRTSLNEIAKALDCTPLKTSVRRREVVSYGKRKVGQIQSKLQSKFARAFDFEADTLDSSEEEDAKCSDSSEDLDRLMSLLMEKVKTATRQEKIKLLTLVPESWSRKKTVDTFGVTDHMVRRSRKLKQEKGILADPDPKKGGRALSFEVTARIIKMYESEEYSRTCPGKKEFVSLKENGVKVHRQKKLLLVNLNELYAEYKKKFPEDKVGFSKFCDLRPKRCVPVTAAGMHSVCVCEQHQNAKLVAVAIPGSHDYKDLLEKIVCSVSDRECMLHLCESCPGKVALEQYLTDIFSSNDFDSDDEVTYKQWTHVDRTSMLCLTSPVNDFIQTACDSYDSLRQHHFIAKAQSSYLSKLKEDLAEEQAIVMLDFAENYSFVMQDEIQGFYWNNAQATLHPFVIYYKLTGDLQCDSTCVISDYLKHDTTTVHAFIATVVSYIKTELPFIKKLLYFSDGAASQYKNFKNFTNLCHHQEDHGLEAVWHFFATSHGKSPCDGIGGTVKRLVARASLQAATDGHILTATEMYNWSSRNISGVKFFYVSAADVADNERSFNLPARFDKAVKVTGTRSHHCFIPISKTQLEMKRISADDHSTLVGGEQLLSELDTAELQPGKYVAAMYDKEWYIGCIVERSDENDDVFINFMHHSKTGLLSWPASVRKNACWVPFQNIVCLVSAPELQGQSARFYKIADEDVALIQKKLPLFT